jgi:hypothetical protein
VTEAPAAPATVAPVVVVSAEPSTVVA